jgi:malonyl CoA-acyl carrier protein transacylase
MKPAAAALDPALKQVKFQKPCVDVISNVTAQPVSYIITLIYAAVVFILYWISMVRRTRLHLY